MDIFATFATDETLEEEGTVVFLKPGATDTSKDPWIKVARMNNNAFMKGFTERQAKLQAEKAELKLTDAEVEIRAKNNMIELMASTILKGFGNLEYQGRPITYSYETSLMLLRVKDFRELVASKASDFELYRVKYLQDAAGN